MQVPTARSMICLGLRMGGGCRQGRMASWSSAAGSGKDQLPGRESWCGFITSLVPSSAISNRNYNDHVLDDETATGVPHD